MELSAALNAVRKLSESERKNVRSTGYYFFLSKKRESDIRTCKSFGRTGRTPWDSCTERLWQDHTVKDHQRLYQPGILVDGEPLPQKGYCPVQMIFQHPEQAVNSRLRMREVLKEGDGISKELIEGLGIEEDWKNRFPQELSGGELQRFCIARALGKGTKYLLCDEITTMLDFITQGQIWNFLIEETKRRGIGMVIVSHSQPLLDHVCTRQIRLNENP